MVKVLAVVGSPRKGGLSSGLSDRALEGAEEAGAQTEKIFLSDFEMEACQDCVELACYDDQHCSFPDEYEEVSERMDAADALVIATPVYWGDVSNAVHWLLAKKMRMRTDTTNGQPVLPIAVAGGTGNGLLEAMKPLYLALEKLRMRSLAAFPVTRFNLERCHEQARDGGRALVREAGTRRPFDMVELFSYYNDLAYRAADRIDERLLLAQLIMEGIRGLDSVVEGELSASLQEAEQRVSSGDKNGAIPLINEICDRGQPLFDEHMGGET
jgi:NAD(P)H-dependent FMN reductase